MRRHIGRPGDGERGAVAIIVLWGMALVFILLAAASFTTRSEVTIARNEIAASRARHAAEAGTELGLFRLLRRSAAGVVLSDGTPEPWQDGSTRIAIAIVDEAGKIDINQAPLELLAGLFVAVGRPQAEALLLACNILDRRGSPAPGCPEPEDERGFAPPGRRFAVPEELAQLPGFDDRLYAAIADCVTVATGASAIAPVVAARAVLLAIPGATPDLVDAFVAQRTMWRDLVSAGDTLNLTPAAPYLMATPGRDFTIEAIATTAGGARYRADLQVRLSGVASHPYDVIAWRSPPAPVAPPPPQRRTP